MLPLSLMLALAGGCASDEAPTVPSRDIRLFFPSETASAMAAEVARFNQLQVKTSHGSTVSVVPFQADGVAAASRLAVGPGDERPALWFASSSLALSALDSKTERAVECTSLATTDLGFSALERDLFALDQHEAIGLLSQIRSDESSFDRARRVIVVQGDPTTSSSGLAVAAMEFALQLSVRPDALTPALLAPAKDTLRGSQGRISRYFHDDQQMLRWLSERSDGQPAVALSSRQQVSARNSAAPSQRLTFVRATAPHLTLDYPLCRILHPRLEADAEEAQKLVQRHFASREMKGALRQLGFTTTDDQLRDESRFPSGSGAEILALWPRARKPSAIAFVIDTSSGSPQNFRESVARELIAFAPRAVAAGDSLGLITTSTRSELLAPLSPTLARFTAALEALPASGSAVPMDGLQEAISILEVVPPASARRSAVLVATQADSSSSISLARLRQSAHQALARSGAALYVLAVRVSPGKDLPPQPAAALRDLATELQASYRETDLAQLPQALRGILQEVE